MATFIRADVCEQQPDWQVEMSKFNIKCFPFALYCSSFAVARLYSLKETHILKSK